VNLVRAMSDAECAGSPSVEIADVAGRLVRRESWPFVERKEEKGMGS